MNNKNFTFFYLKNQISDPAIQPTKPIQSLQIKDESQQRRIPKGRYDTTYRREYLNFNDVC
jgi:hypothetical protein